MIIEEEKKREEIALFRYGLIAPVIYKNVEVQAEYFREVSGKEIEVPYRGRKKIRVSTLKVWLRRYREEGFEALKPKVRQHKGRSRKINGAISGAIKRIIEKHTYLSCSTIYRLLIAGGHITSGEITEATIRKYIRDNQLKDINTPTPRKKYEKEHINEMWISDTMHGPYIHQGKKKFKSYLIAVIDDHSMVVVGGNFFFNENSINLESVLKGAIRRFGVPKIFYCDNGSLFSSSHLQLDCARLGIALVHSKPYDSPSRGKIERFFRTIRQKFLPLLNFSDIKNIEQLNNLLSRWIEEEYHRQRHSGIEEKPLERFIKDLQNITIRRVSEEELDTAFQITIKRKVKNDSTISVGGVLYECPRELIGKKIEIRYPSDKPEVLTIYQKDKPICQLKKLNIYENSNLGCRGIIFREKEEEND